MSNLNVIDFFCGGGGMSYGLSKAGLNVIAGIDINNACKKTYEYNNKKSTFINEDIILFSPEKLKKKLNLKINDKKLVFVGCSPCQYWSLIKSNKSRSKKTAFLLDNFLEYIRFFKPGYVVIENVPGILKNKNSPLLKFKNALKKLNYFISDSLVNAIDYGVPQSRIRYLLLASNVSHVELPKKRKTKKINVRDFIGEKKKLPEIVAGHCDESPRRHSSAALSEINLERIRKTQLDGGNRLCWKDDPKLQLNAYKNKDSYFNDVYARMYWDKPAPTITTKFMSFSNGRFGHPEQDRAISLREGAILQSFPMSYSFKGSLQNCAMIIGNAVPPLLARAIGKALMENE